MDFDTYIINIIGGPGVGKAILSALIFSHLKIKTPYSIEYVQEYAKTLVWMGDFETLNNQYYVTTHQYNLLKRMNKKVKFIITDGALCQGLYYNKFNRGNICDIAKTEAYILKIHHEFKNINLVLKRGKFAYETEGRLQTEDEAKEIDGVIRHMLKQHNIEFTEIESDTSEDNINKIITLIKSKTKYEKIATVVTDYQG